MSFLFDAASRSEVIDDLCEQLSTQYVFPEMAEQCNDLLRSRLTEGSYDNITKPEELCHALTVDLQGVSKDRHLVLLWRPEETGNDDAVKQEPQEQKRVAEREAARRNYGFRRIEILPGNVGLIELAGFDDPQIGGDTAVAAMRFVSNTDALLLDVRGNMGGDGRMVVLICSYLCPGNTWDLSGSYSRKVGRVEPWWTMPYVPGPYYDGKPVFVLTGPLTFSGGELLAYDLQALKRATVVGEVTGGAAHGAEFFRLPHGVDALISVSAASNPITGGNWEATGVQPDIPVPQEDALRTAHAAAIGAILSGSAGGALTQQYRKELETLRSKLNASPP
jgi:C-terminal processing protease CtpA/Prc